MKAFDLDEFQKMLGRLKVGCLESEALKRSVLDPHADTTVVGYATVDGKLVTIYRRYGVGGGK